MLNQKEYLLIKLKSGALQLIHNKCTASAGIVSNGNFFLRDKQKAGVNRLIGVVRE